MKEGFNQPAPETPEDLPHKESVEELRTLFSEVERIFETEGREGAKPHLPKVYTTLQELNKSDMSDGAWTRVWVWNKDGGLTEEEFNELNLRRKKLSNAIGIMTASGVVRHDLNEI